jgi:hypothetical protein
MKGSGTPMAAGVEARKIALGRADSEVTPPPAHTLDGGGRPFADSPPAARWRRCAVAMGRDATRSA